jgi:hypothetical protein
MCPSVAPVRRSGSIARRNARSRAAVRTRSALLAETLAPDEDRELEAAE